MQCKDSTSDGFEQDPPVCSLPKGSTCGEKRAEENGLEDGQVSDTWGMVREGNTFLYRRALEPAEWERRRGGKLGARSKSLEKRVSEGAKTTYRRVLWRVLAGSEEKGSLTLELKVGSSPRKGVKNLSPKLG